jgi:AraC-like DNA-binding protein
MLVYNILMFINVIKYQEDRNDELSSIRIRWSKAVNLFFSTFIISYSTYYVLVNYDFFQPQWDYMISIVMSLAIYGIGYMAFTQPEIFNGIFLNKVFVPKKYKSSQLTDSLANELFDRLTDYFDNKKPYLNPELRQANVCEELGCTTHQVSQLINERTGSNINSFIRKYRLGYAENLIRENPQIDIKTVFYQSGFNNKTSFNSAFKQKFGCTPSDYRKTLLGSYDQA